MIDSLKHKMNSYRLRNVSLNIRQGLNAKQQLDLSQIKASILEDAYSNLPKTDTIKVRQIPASIDSAVLSEIKVLYPAIKSFGVTKVVIKSTDSPHVDTQRVALATFKKPLRKTDASKLQEWLQKRYKLPKLKLIAQ